MRPFGDAISANRGRAIKKANFFYYRTMSAEDGDGPLVKLLLIGESSVGKTCLLIRYAENRFQDTFFTTVGMDFKGRTVVICDRKVRLQIWDTAGQEKFRGIARAYYRGAHGILLVFDVTNQFTFAQTRGWMSSIRENTTSSVAIILVGNKCDLPRQVTVEQAQAFAQEYGIQYYETSAKDGMHVESTFMALAKMAVENEMGILDRTDARRRRMSLSDPRARKSKGCC
jgi:small GTP-binding protein